MNTKNQKDRFNRYIQFVTNQDDKIQTAKYLISIIVEYLNFYESIQSLECEHGTRDNSIIEEIYRKIAVDVNLQSETIRIDRIHEDDLKFYKETKIENRLYEIDITDLPILLNPWNGDRVVDNMHGINENNVFDGKRYSYNIENHYLYPMDIFVCHGANHSQFAAKFKNKGVTLVKEILNFSELYNCIYFDGESYRVKKTDEIIFLQYNDEDIFYSGVIFELGRFLFKTNYHRFEFTKN